MNGWTLFLVLTTFYSLAQREPNHQLNYLINLEHAGEGYADFALDYRAPEKHKDSVTFILPSNWGDEQPLAYFRLTMFPNHGYRFSSDSSQLICALQGEQLTIRYRIINGIRDTMPGDGEVYHPQITPRYFSAY